MKLLRAALISFPLLLAPTVAQSETLVVTNAKALSRGAKPIDNATIVIINGRISSVASGGAIPSGARIIDAGGRIVTPGLMNGATQLGLIEIGGDTDDRSVSSGPLGPSFDVQYALNPNSMLISRARADGLTRAMTYPGGAATAPFSGMGALLRLDQGQDIVDRPRAAMFAVVGGSVLDQAGGSRAGQWALLRNALAEARAFAADPGAAARHGRLLNHPDVMALQPVIAGRMKLVVLAHRESDLRQAIRLATDEKLQVVIIGGAEAWRVRHELAAADIPVVLDPAANLPMNFDQLGARLDNAALLQRAGVLIAFTAPAIHLNYNAGSALREGAGLAVAYGLPYAEAIKAVTENPAKIWGIGERYGVLAAGFEGDLVIWDGDPLEPSSAPTAVFVRGRQQSLANRQADLRDRYSPRRARDGRPLAYP